MSGAATITAGMRAGMVPAGIGAAMACAGAMAGAAAMAGTAGPDAPVLQGNIAALVPGPQAIPLALSMLEVTLLPMPAVMRAATAAVGTTARRQASLRKPLRYSCESVRCRTTVCSSGCAAVFHAWP